MPILPEILVWSQGRPLWQQDALRRLVEQPNLTTIDRAALVDLCKSEFGITIKDVGAAVPLSEAYMAMPDAVRQPAVRLTRIHNVHNVNALHNDQQLNVATSGITVVYGDNGAGKSGYVRVLKQVCRARGARDTVHPNAYADEIEPASAMVCYEVTVPEGQTGTGQNGAVLGATSHEVTWRLGVAGSPELAQVSVFDSRAASVYVTERNDVAYLPHGTDLFPRLVGVVEWVKGDLETELANLERNRDRFESIPFDTVAFGVLDNLHVPQARDRFEHLAALSDEERDRLEALRLEDRRYKAENPIGRAKELRHCKARLAAARERLAQLEAELDASVMRNIAEARQALTTARAAAELAAGGAFVDTPIGGVGSDAWRVLWDAARRFAEQGAVPPQAFPPEEATGAVCLLCQQQLDELAYQRMRRFEEFVKDETRVAVDRATYELEKHIAALTTLTPKAIADDALLEEIKSLDEELARILTDCIDEITRCREEIMRTASSSDTPTDWASLAYTPSDAVLRLANLEEQIETQAAGYEAAVDPDTRKAMETELREFEARAALTRLRDRVYAEIDRQVLKEKLKECIRSANTAAITKRNTEVLRETVSVPLAEEFSRQIAALDLTHLPISVDASHGQKGKAFHTLALDKKTAAKIPTDEVLSEGEHRSTALAAFFAEVSLQDSASTVVFDDPVSSLDHERRRYVAQRIVEIARTRPVLIFTHDLVFLWMLQGAASNRTVPLAPRYFRRDGTGAGLISEDWPWDGQDVRTRLGVLKTAAAKFPKLAATDPRQYEIEVRNFYGKLRETWERAVEEVLFNGAIRRFSKEIQTLRLRNLHRLTEQHIQDFEAGMIKTSAWIQGHDHAVELSLPVPDPVEVQADLDALDRWITEVRSQHQAKTDRPARAISVEV